MIAFLFSIVKILMSRCTSTGDAEIKCIDIGIGICVGIGKICMFLPIISIKCISSEVQKFRSSEVQKFRNLKSLNFL